MISRYIVCTVPIVPRPESIVDSLRDAGHTATIIQTRHWLDTVLSCELAVGPKGDRILIDVSEDLHADRDIDTSSHEMVEELVQVAELPSIRHLIDIRCWEHTDPNVIANLIDYLCKVTSGRVVGVERRSWA